MPLPLPLPLPLASLAWSCSCDMLQAPRDLETCKKRTKSMKSCRVEHTKTSESSCICYHHMMTSCDDIMSCHHHSACLAKAEPGGLGTKVGNLGREGGRHKAVSSWSAPFLCKRTAILQIHDRYSILFKDRTRRNQIDASSCSIIYKVDSIK